MQLSAACVKACACVRSCSNLGHPSLMKIGRSIIRGNRLDPDSPPAPSQLITE